MLVRLILKYKNRLIKAISTLYQTSETAEIEMSWPKILVNPQMKTVKWRMIKFLFMPEDVLVAAMLFRRFA